jgi:TrmH family RNA methyltransferase
MVSSEAIERCAVVLVRPENPENIGLVARGMKNTGFSELRLAGIRRLSPKAYKTAVHAEEILDRARLFADLAGATADLHLIAAATAKQRKIGSTVGLAEAVARIGGLPTGTRVGLLFGNERTGLTGEELLRANLIFTIPQATRQPSYNLGAAVLLTLFSLFAEQGSTGEAAVGGPESPFGSSRQPKTRDGRDQLLSRQEQDEVIGRILEKLATRGFTHRTNQAHVTAWIHDFFGRQAITDLDRGFLLALFDKGVGPNPGGEIVLPDASILPMGEKQPFK